MTLENLLLKKLPLGILMLFLGGCDFSYHTSLTQKSLIYCSEGSPESFNPQTVLSSTTLDATAYQLYDRLITFDEKSQTFQPSLAKSWYIANDGKMITFYLRRDVEFHHTNYFTPTRKFNAEDVVFSFQRVLDPEHEFHYASTGRYPFFENNKFEQLVTSVEKIDDYSVRFILKEGNSSFLTLLASPQAVVLSKEYGENLAYEYIYHQMDTMPIGTGPYKYQEYRGGSLIRYYKHPEYWGITGAIEQLVFDITPSNTGRLTKLLAGECDVVANPIAHEKISKSKNFTLEALPKGNIAYLAFNTQKAPFDNPRVRQAITHAIDVNTIINTVYFGQAIAAKSILPSNSWAYHPQSADIEYSPTQAIQMLTNEGYGHGFNMDLWVPPDNSEVNPNPFTMAELIQKDLKLVGINVNIYTDEPNSFKERIRKGEYQTVLSDWTATDTDPDHFLAPLLSCDALSFMHNKAQWCYAPFDTALKNAISTNDLNQRKQFYYQALSILSNNAPVMPIAHTLRYQARANIVMGNIIESNVLTFKNLVKQ